MFKDNQFDAGMPIYLQIIACIKQKIVAGEWAAGERVPPVRDLAIEFGVNPNTMQRSLTELEREGLLYSERTSGRFITRQAELIASVRDDLAEEVLKTFLHQMKQMGYAKEQILQKIKDAESEN